MKRCRRRNAYADATLLASCRSPCRFEGLVEISEYCTGIVEECATSVRQHHAARLAAKQLHIELVFGRLDLAAEGRLLDS
jgi:hypothetical protein